MDQMTACKRAGRGHLLPSPVSTSCSPAFSVFTPKWQVAFPFQLASSSFLSLKRAPFCASVAAHRALAQANDSAAAVWRPSRMRLDCRALQCRVSSREREKERLAAALRERRSRNLFASLVQVGAPCSRIISLLLLLLIRIRLRQCASGARVSNCVHTLSRSALAAGDNCRRFSALFFAPLKGPSLMQTFACEPNSSNARTHTQQYQFPYSRLAGPKSAGRPAWNRQLSAQRSGRLGQMASPLLPLGFVRTKVDNYPRSSHSRRLAREPKQLSRLLAGPKSVGARPPKNQDVRGYCTGAPLRLIGRTAVACLSGPSTCSKSAA